MKLFISILLSCLYSSQALALAYLMNAKFDIPKGKIDLDMPEVMTGSSTQFVGRRSGFLTFRGGERMELDLANGYLWVSGEPMNMKIHFLKFMCADGYLYGVISSYMKIQTLQGELNVEAGMLQNRNIVAGMLKDSPILNMFTHKNEIRQGQADYLSEACTEGFRARFQDNLLQSRQVLKQGAMTITVNQNKAAIRWDPRLVKTPQQREAEDLLKETQRILEEE